MAGRQVHRLQFRLLIRTFTTVQARRKKKASIMMTSDLSAPRRNGWNIGLWVAQALLAAAYLAAGSMKLFTPIEALAASLPYVTTMPELFIRFVGLMEILGALGLILPSVTRILPTLTPAAAVRLSFV